MNLHTLSTVIALGICLAATVSRGEPLKWETLAKDYEVKPGETHARFAFTVTNTSTEDVVITDVQPSCGCTIASLPARPWRIAPGAGGEVKFDVNLVGKSGFFTKTARVETSRGPTILTLRVTIPDEAASRRMRNQMFAAADRQLVFKGECAKCHAEPLRDKLGQELFVVACGICHAAAQRASLVPDLRITASSRSAEDWKKWITDGRAGSLMPAFGAERGGPLTQKQIDSLVSFLAEAWSANPDPAGRQPSR